MTSAIRNANRPKDSRLARVARASLLLSFASMGAYHALAIIVPAWARGATPLRHAVFIFVNWLAVWAIVKRHRWVRPLLVLLALQQFRSHGVDAWRAAMRGEVDIASIVIVAMLPIGLAIAWSSLGPEAPDDPARPKDA